MSRFGGGYVINNLTVGHYLVYRGGNARVFHFGILMLAERVPSMKLERYLLMVLVLFVLFVIGMSLRRFVH